MVFVSGRRSGYGVVKMSLTTHYRIVAVLLIAMSLLALSASAVMGLLMGAFACDNPPGGDTTICLVVGGGFILFGALILALPPLWTAIGILRRQRKMRQRAQIMAAIACILFIPIGTIAGLYMFYVIRRLDPDGNYFSDPGNSAV